MWWWADSHAPLQIQGAVMGVSATPPELMTEALPGVPPPCPGLWLSKGAQAQSWRFLCPLSYLPLEARISVNPSGLWDPTNAQGRGLRSVG